VYTLVVTPEGGRNGSVAQPDALLAPLNDAGRKAERQPWRVGVAAHVRCAGASPEQQEHDGADYAESDPVPPLHATI
jgi:hypothetical protein